MIPQNIRKPGHRFPGRIHRLTPEGIEAGNEQMFHGMTPFPPAGAGCDLLYFIPVLSKTQDAKVPRTPPGLFILYIFGGEFSTPFQIFPLVLPLKYPRRYGKIIG
jgi:hypothetical protein